MRCVQSWCESVGREGTMIARNFAMRDVSPVCMNTKIANKNLHVHFLFQRL
jgi:hypothetical protein